MQLISNKDTKFYILFLLISSAWAGVFFILPDFIDNPFSGLYGFVILFSHFLSIGLFSLVIIYLISINRYLFAILFPIYSLFGAVLAYYRFAFKVTLTPMLIDATLNNDLGTTLDVISFYEIVFVILSVFIAILLVIFRFKKIQLRSQLWHFVFGILSLVLVLSLSDRFRMSLMQRFPLNLYSNFAEYYKNREQIATQRISPDSTLNYISQDSLTIVLVIGESLRSDHQSINGYGRNTNPFLSKVKNLITFPKIYSEYTNTNRSLPHILTRADSSHTQLAFTESSFISLFRKSHFYTAWITNQDAANTYAGFMKECDTIKYAHPEKSVYNYNSWFDEDLLPFFDKTLSRNNPNKLIILHTIGSHWYYNNHYSPDFQIFNPVTKSRILLQCKPEEILNSYDNTVLYTDWFLNNVINRLIKTKSLLIFLSDHGEVLGENGSYLHANDDLAAKNPACFVWFSDKYQTVFPGKIKCLKNNATKRYRTDFLYHSILSGSNIPSKSIINPLDIFYEHNKE